MSNRGNRGSMPKPASADEQMDAAELSEMEQSVEVEKPAIVDQGNSNVKRMKKEPEGILVRANRDVFYKNQRIKPGEEYMISGEQFFGECHTCIDPVMESKRKKFIAEKKAKARARAKEAQERE